MRPLSVHDPKLHTTSDTSRPSSLGFLGEPCLACTLAVFFLHLILPGENKPLKGTPSLTSPQSPLPTCLSLLSQWKTRPCSCLRPSLRQKPLGLQTLPCPHHMLRHFRLQPCLLPELWSPHQAPSSPTWCPVGRPGAEAGDPKPDKA